MTGATLHSHRVTFCAGFCSVQSAHKNKSSRPMNLRNNNPVTVSVIIPVYNTEAYVGEAVESVCRQTLQALEIIVVDDGSTDGSLAVVNALAKQDPRIKVHVQKNAGQSVARNNALKFATGHYLYFMDSDDVIEPDTLAVCVERCEAESLDFVFFDADILNKEAQLAASLKYNRAGCVAEGEVRTGNEMLAAQLQTRSYTPSPCLYLIRMAFLQQCKLGFYPGIIHEDQLFSALLYLRAGRVMYVQQAFFKRRLREASTMTQRFSWRNMNGYLTVANELLRYKRQEAGTTEKVLIDALLRQMLDAAVWNAHVLPLRQRFDLAKLCLQSRYRNYVSSRTLASMLAKALVR